MNVVGSSYVPVKANTVMPMAEGGSGPDSGWEQTGIFVNWNSTTGVTGSGWDQLIHAPNSPFGGMNSSQIVDHITQHGNLYLYFSKVADLSSRQQDEFYNHLKRYYGYTEEGGCIGDKQY